jgi:tetratricopeptide (TPR) repeat protein
MGQSTLRASIAVSLLVLVAALAWTPISNNDIWLHLKTGSLILERGAVPRAEEYTYTREGAPLVDHEWLSQVIFSLCFGALGLAGLSLLKTLITAATLAVVFIEAARAEPGSEPPGEAARLAAATIAATWAALLIASHLFIRPHLFTFLLAAVFAAILPRLEEAAPAARRRWIAALLVLQVLWVNLHGGFVVGILLAALNAVARAIARRRLVADLALPPLLAAVSLLNPYGTRIYALVGAFNDPAFKDLIVEWKSPFRDPFALTPLFWVYAAFLAAIVPAVVRALARRAYFPALAAVSLAAMSVTSRRHVSLLGAVSAPLVGRALAALAARVRVRAAPAAAAGWGSAVVVLALSAFIALAGLPWERGERRLPGSGIGENIPVEALQVMSDDKLMGRVGCSLAFGAYVTWAGWPDLKTSIDSRLEIFGGEFLRWYESALRDPEMFADLMRRDPFDLALLSWQQESVAGALQALASDPNWALIYFDDVAVLYARRGPERAATIERDEFRLVDPARFLRAAAPPAGADLADVEREARRAVAAPPPIARRPAMNAVARTILGSVLQHEGRHAEAIAELRAAVTARPNDTVGWGLLGLSLLQSGDRSGAHAAFTELKRRVPASVFADRMLKEVGGP